MYLGIEELYRPQTVGLCLPSGFVRSVEKSYSRQLGENPIAETPRSLRKTFPSRSDPAYRHLQNEHGNLVQFALGRICLSPGAIPTLFPDYLPSLQPTVVQPRPSPAEKAAKRKRETETVNEYPFEVGTSSQPILTFKVLTEEVRDWLILWQRTNAKVNWQLMVSAERVCFFELVFDLEEPRIARGIILKPDLINRKLITRCSFLSTVLRQLLNVTLCTRT